MPRKTGKSESAFEQARRVLVGGVNSPVRAFAAVGGTPSVIASAQGSHITDVDGNEYIDYVGSYGPAILGHAAGPVVKAVQEAVARGMSYGAPTEVETQLARAIIDIMPSIERIRFVSSGTEAVMTAVRLARGFTWRTKIIKCIGCYHGHSDPLLVSAGSGATTLGVPSSPGVPAGATSDTVLVPYNDLSAVQDAIEEHAGHVAAMLLEPVAGNMGVVPPADGYLAGLRELCDAHEALLIFDEVMSGFRVALGGAQALWGVQPDLTTLGKIIGGGMPVGAVGGRAEIMDRLAPIGPVYQAGTLSGNPVAMAAGLATLDQIQADTAFYAKLEARSAALADGLIQSAASAGLAGRVCVNRVGSMLTCFFRPPPVEDYAGATASNVKAFAAYFHAMLDEMIYLPPSQFEALFVSAAHSDQDIAATVAASGGAFAAASKAY
ncbi:MAG: glutamate-1-semialdehyde 2,1-aminomutase [Phycisphaerae bacterium]